jgi:hypothetical protein
VNLKHLTFRAALSQYEKQAQELLTAYRASDSAAVDLFHQNHPRFLDEDIPWLPKDIADAEITEAQLEADDARLVIARWYGFRDWPALAAFVAEATREDSPVARFEAAVDAVVNGEIDTLRSMLRDHPELIHARSTRITPCDPPVHRSTLLHYVGANGVEGYRQKTPANAVEIAKVLLEAGAEVDSLADLYGEGCTTMGLLVSSCHPAQAGLQSALANVLIDFGASLEPVGPGKWSSPLMTALAFGYHDTAATLVARGAQVNHLAAAAGLGLKDRAVELLPSADAATKHRALVLAAQLGHAEIVGLLLDAGEDPDRYNPEGLHSHSTPLHQAALAGHEAVVRLLAERGARLDIKDKIYQGTALGWAIHGGQTAIEAYLRSRATEK